MDKTYKVSFKNGSYQIVTGVIVFFSSINTDVPRPTNAVYLNADEVLSIVEKVEVVREEV